MKDLICFLGVVLSLSLWTQDSETLTAPESNDEVICGVGFVTLLATSDVTNNAYNLNGMYHPAVSSSFGEP